MDVLAPQQLAEFLVSVADRPDAPRSRDAAVQHAAGALHADAAAIVVDGVVRTAIGFGDDLPVAGILEVARGVRSRLELPGAGGLSTATVPIGGSTTDRLVLARGEDHPFTTEEIDLIRAMGRVLELSLQALDVPPAAEAARQESHDALTGLANRGRFLRRLQDRLAAGTAVATFIVDLDRFQVVNDSFGHSVGDQLLVRAGHRIRACLSSDALVARLGGDEFAVLLPYGTCADDAVPAARRVLDTLREPFHLNGGEVFVSCSIGIAVSTAAERDVGQVMVQADLAMNQAKLRGRNSYEVFRPDLQAAFRADQELESDLRRAVVRHEFELRYQPIVQLRTGDIIGIEALVRWRHPTRGIVAPLEFIAKAEQTGMIVPIGEWVLREACRQAARWNTRRGDAVPLSVSVNLSAVQLDQADLPALVADALRESGLPGHRLVLELTESLLVDHRESTVRQLRLIKDMGVRLAIDDFGTGYSSLAYLRRFPVDIIKIDKSFVDEVGDVPAASALTLGIVQLGRALRLSTIAEGIEHAGQLSQLTDGDCELGQGYYFAEPLTGADLSALLFAPVTRTGPVPPVPPTL